MACWWFVGRTTGRLAVLALVTLGLLVATGSAAYAPNIMGN